MSKEALEAFEAALNVQHNRNEARRIRTGVTEARQNTHLAGLRWPFELLQNALDAGPRDEKTFVTIRLRSGTSKVVFEHDGAPFSSPELAALLSGGSSKEFESKLTTGRFGTGFLVTHVLSDETRLRGLLEAPNGLEQFDLTLERGGDEVQILQNIWSCNEAIRLATPIADLDGVASAVFEYPVPNDSALGAGPQALRSALPYIFMTRQSLGCAVLEEEDGSIETWTPGDIDREDLDSGVVEHRSLRVERNGSQLSELHVFRFMTEENASASAMLLAERDAAGWTLRLLDPDAPRVYREYPLRGSGFLPINFVLDGKFDTDQERNRLSMDEGDKELLERAFSAGVIGVSYAFTHKWTNAHLLAEARKVNTGFDASNAGERQWWNHQLLTFAQRLAELPIIECVAGSLPALAADGGAYADFVIPRLSLQSTGDETSSNKMWPLVAAATRLLPPLEGSSDDWTRIAEGWQQLGLHLDPVTVSRLAEWVRKDDDGSYVQTIEGLRIEGDKKEWIARFLDIVGECWKTRNGVDVSVLAGLLPDQNGQLHSPDTLKRDQDVTAELKDICSSMGMDIRSQLLVDGLAEFQESHGLSCLRYAIESSIPSTLSQDNVLAAATKNLQALFPEDKECTEQTLAVERASIRLLNYLGESLGEGPVMTARQVPLITSNRRAVRWSQNRVMMAPVSNWHELAQPFANAYPPQRVLAEAYCGDESAGIPNVVNALVRWKIAVADPISTDEPAELRDRRLAAITKENSQGVVVIGQRFSQIALLQPEVLNRCQEGEDEARALLGLVLCYVAPTDPAWQTDLLVRGRKASEQIDIVVSGALWLADLKFRAWVPVPGEDGRPAKMLASPATLEHLLDPAWLQGNDAAIRLLSEWFDFDELDLRLLGVAPDEADRGRLRNSLAKLIELGGADSELYESLRQDLEARKKRRRDVDRWRRLGLAVQDSVRLAMEAHSLQLELVDRGFDYRVTGPADDALNDGAWELRLGHYFLEVKATTTGGARLTPLQASTAAEEAERYVICVVDLRDVSQETLDGEWTAIQIDALAKVVPDLSGKVEETCMLIELATTTPVGIRNESALRYEVPASVWEAGLSIAEWVASVSAST